MMSMPSWVVPGGTMPAGTTGSAAGPGTPSLLHRHRLRQVARLVNVRAPGDRGVVGEQLSGITASAGDSASWVSATHRTSSANR